jgi:hypothetical protein
LCKRPAELVKAGRPLRTENVERLESVIRSGLDRVRSVYPGELSLGVDVLLRVSDEGSSGRGRAPQRRPARFAGTTGLCTIPSAFGEAELREVIADARGWVLMTARVVLTEVGRRALGGNEDGVAQHRG